MTYFNNNKVYLNGELYYTISRSGKRIIFAPCEELKKIQKDFKRALQWTFPLKMNTFDSAKIHCGKKWVLKMDIKDFYNSVPVAFIEHAVSLACNGIKFSNTYYYFMISTLDRRLPTGAVTSAHIANAGFRPLDKRIKAYSNLLRVNYSRYMDDLTFSSDDKFILNLVEKYVVNLLKQFEFRINPHKTKYISANKQQNVLGLVVNNKLPRLPKTFRKNIRAMIHNYSIYKNSGAKEIDYKFRCLNEYKIAQLKGYLAYVKHVDIESYNQLIEYSEKLNLNLSYL